MNAAIGALAASNQNLQDLLKEDEQQEVSKTTSKLKKV
jgi:hypothetical protein